MKQNHKPQKITFLGKVTASIQPFSTKSCNNKRKRKITRKMWK